MWSEGGDLIVDVALKGGSGFREFTVFFVVSYLFLSSASSTFLVRDSYPLIGFYLNFLRSSLWCFKGDNEEKRRSDSQWLVHFRVPLWLCC